MEKHNAIISCLSASCPERFSLCCHVGSELVVTTDDKEGWFACRRCGIPFQGGECKATTMNLKMPNLDPLVREGDVVSRLDPLLQEMKTELEAQLDLHFPKENYEGRDMTKWKVEGNGRGQALVLFAQALILADKAVKKARDGGKYPEKHTVC